MGKVTRNKATDTQVDAAVTETTGKICTLTRRGTSRRTKKFRSTVPYQNTRCTAAQANPPRTVSLSPGSEQTPSVLRCKEAACNDNFFSSYFSSTSFSLNTLL